MVAKELEKCPFYDEIEQMERPELADTTYEACVGDFEVSLFIYDGDKDEGSPTYEVNFTTTIEGNIEDFGIGSYEFWGSKGNDSQLGWNIDGLTYNVKLPDNLKDLLDSIEEHMISRAAESDFPEPDYPEPDPDDCYDYRDDYR